MKTFKTLFFATHLFTSFDYIPKFNLNLKSKISNIIIQYFILKINIKNSLVPGYKWAISKTFQGNLSSGSMLQLSPESRVSLKDKRAILKLSFPPYFPSPARGIFLPENWTLIWWVLPVWRSTRTREKPSVLPKTSYSKEAFLTPFRSLFTIKLLGIRII